MSGFMPDNLYDIDQARALCVEVRSMRSRPSQRDHAFATFKKQIVANTIGNFVVTLVPSTKQKWPYKYSRSS